MELLKLLNAQPIKLAVHLCTRRRNLVHCVLLAYLLTFVFFIFCLLDCDVIVQTDTSISRVHAEIVVEKMVSRDPSHTVSANFPSHVYIVDRSKYGTSINKESGNDGSRLNKDQQAVLKDGDYVTFGTSTATFR